MDQKFIKKVIERHPATWEFLARCTQEAINLEELYYSNYLKPDDAVDILNLYLIVCKTDPELLKDQKMYDRAIAQKMLKTMRDDISQWNKTKNE